MKREVDLSDQQIRFLRNSLLYFRERFRMSWSEVASAVMESKAYGKHRREAHSVEERYGTIISDQKLVRFVSLDQQTGYISERPQSTPPTIVLKIIVDFLIEWEVITQRSLDAQHHNYNPRDSIFELIRYPSSDVARKLSGSFCHRTQVGTKVFELSLQIDRPKNAMHFNIRGVFSEYHISPATREVQIQDEMPKNTRTGRAIKLYGWTAQTKAGQLLSAVFEEGGISSAHGFCIEGSGFYIASMPSIDFFIYNNSIFSYFINEITNFHSVDYSMVYDIEMSEIRDGVHSKYETRRGPIKQTEEIGRTKDDFYRIMGLEQEGADAQTSSNDRVDGDTFLRALKFGEDDIIAAYRDQGGDINYEDRIGRRAIHIAAHDVTGNTLSEIEDWEGLNFLGYDISKDSYPPKNHDLPSSIACKWANMTLASRLMIAEMRYAKQHGLIDPNALELYDAEIGAGNDTPEP